MRAATGAGDPVTGEPWNRDEIDVLVEAYMAMRRAEFLGQLNRTDFGGDSIPLKEDGVHDRHQRSSKLAPLSS
jgi:hypothetical protein